MSDFMSTYFIADMDEKYRAFLGLAREAHRRFFPPGVPLEQIVQNSIAEGASIELFQSLALLRVHSKELQRFVALRKSSVGRLNRGDALFVISTIDEAFICNELKTAEFEINKVLDNRQSGESFSIDLLLAEQGIKFLKKYELDRHHLKLAVEWFFRCSSMGDERLADFIFDEDGLSGDEVDFVVVPSMESAESFLKDDSIWAALELSPFAKSEHVNQRCAEIMPIVLQKNAMSRTRLDVYEEACKSYIVGHPRAGTALCRTLLEAIIVDRAESFSIPLVVKNKKGETKIDKEGEEKNTGLTERIEAFPGQPEWLKPDMKTVRDNGNLAVHANKLDERENRSDEDRCIESLKLVKKIAEEIYKSA